MSRLDDKKVVADRYFNAREPYERSRSTLENLTNVKKQSNRMIIDSIKSNKDMMSMLSPKVTKTRPSMLSPKGALDAPNLRNGPYSPAAMDLSPLISPTKKKKKDVTFGGSTRAATEMSPHKSPPGSALAVKEDTNGKALNHEMSGQGKKLKNTRFNLAGPGVEMTTDIME